MPNQSKCSVTSVCRAVRNRRFNALSRLSTELRKYWELIDHLQPGPGRREALQIQLGMVRRATAVYEKSHAELLAYLEKHPELGLPPTAAHLMRMDSSDSYERQIA